MLLIRAPLCDLSPSQVKIGLEVVSGLSAECDQHFARFGRTVLNILLSLLDNSALDNDVFNAAMDTVGRPETGEMLPFAH